MKIKVENTQTVTDVNSASVAAGGSSNPPSDSATITASTGNGTSTATSTMIVSASPNSEAHGDSTVVSSTSPTGSYTSSTTTTSASGSLGSSVSYSSSTSSSSSISTSTPTTIVNNLLVPSTILTYSFKNTNVNFNLMNISNVSDFSVSPSGRIAVVSNNNLYNYDYIKNQFVIDSTISNVKKVTLAPDATPYVINNNNEAFFFNILNMNWVKLPICALEIAVGNKGDVYVIECMKNEVLQITCTSGPDNRLLLKFLHMYDSPQCSFVNLHSKANKIDVLQEGVPIILSDFGKILYYYNNNWYSFLGMYAKDLNVSNEGLLFLIASDNSIYSVNYFFDTPTLFKLPGTAQAIESGPFSMPFIVKDDNNLYSSMSFLFN